MAKGGKTHIMPDGSTMLDSDHYAKGGLIAMGKGVGSNAENFYELRDDSDWGGYVVVEKPSNKEVVVAYEFVDAVLAYAEYIGRMVDGEYNDDYDYAKGGKTRKKRKKR